MKRRDFLTSSAVAGVGLGTTPPNDREGIAFARSLAPSLETENVRWYGAVGDGLADDTVPIRQALDAAISAGRAVSFPPGSYRVTSSYSNTAPFGHVVLLGSVRGHSGRSQSDNGGSRIVLDNAAGGEFFTQASARGRLVVRDMTFQSSQYVPDRPFFRFTSVLHQFHFENVNFDSVERPIWFASGSYFQSGSLTNTQFWDSGTIHSETSALVGTLLVLDNVNHEGTIPANTDRILCDLSGVRNIQATNFLLEGTAVPAAGWTILRLHNAGHEPWVRSPTASFHGFWSEWDGDPQPRYVVDQVSGRAAFFDARLNTSATAQYRLSAHAHVIIERSSFAQEGSSDLSGMFSFEDFGSHATLRDCTLKDSPTSVADLHHDQITVESCNVARSPAAADEVFGTTVVSNSAGALIYKWDGGYMEADPVRLTVSGGTTSQLDTDATYGRRLTVIPRGDTISLMIEAKLRGVLSQYTQFGFLAKLRLPTYTSGNFFVRAVEDGAGVATWQLLDAARHSGQELTIVLPYRSKNPITEDVGIQFGSDGDSPAAGVSGNLELYYFAAYAGETIPRREYPSYPRNIATWADEVPRAGSFVAGDIVYNTAPALDAGNMSLLGWRRLTTGGEHVTGTDWAFMYVSHSGPEG